MTVLTIIILTAATILEFLETIKKASEDYKKKAKKVVIICIKSAVTLGLGYLTVSSFIKEQRDIEINSTRGEFGEQKDSFTNSPGLYFGKGGIVGAMYPFAFNTEEEVPPIKITTKNNQLMIDAYIRDSKGDMIATIQNRKWEITNPIDIDYNNDDSAFEIITLDRRVVFQIELRKDSILCNGMICSPSGKCMFINGDSSQLLISYNDNTNPQRFVIPKIDKLKRIFKYPRYQYLCVRDNREGEEQNR